MLVFFVAALVIPARAKCVSRLLKYWRSLRGSNFGAEQSPRDGMGVFGTLITMGGGCAIFGIDDVLGGGEGVNVGKDEDEGEGEVSIG